MATDTNAARIWHTVVTPALGTLTLVRDADALRGLHLPHPRFVLDLEQTIHDPADRARPAGRAVVTR